MRSPRSLSLPPLPTLHQALAAAEIAARRAVKQGLQGLQRLRGGGRGKKVVEEEEEEEDKKHKRNVTICDHQTLFYRPLDTSSSV